MTIYYDDIVVAGIKQQAQVFGQNASGFADSILFSSSAFGDTIMAIFNKFNSFVESLSEKQHNLGSDSLKWMLTNVAPVAGNTVKANITEITAQNGYSAGGSAASISSSAQTSGTYKLVLADTTFTASGGSFGPFRYAVLYNDTATNDELICWADYGSSISLDTGETFVVDCDAATGVLTLA